MADASHTADPKTEVIPPFSVLLKRVEERRFEEAMARYCGAKAAVGAAVSDDLIDLLTEELEPHFQKLRKTPPPDLDSFSLKVRIFADLQGDPHGDLAVIINDIEHLKG